MSDTAPQAVDLGFPADVAECLAKKRTYVQGSPLQELRALLTANDSPAKDCDDATLCRFLESNVDVRHLEIKGVSIKKTAKHVTSSMAWRTKVGAATCMCPDCGDDPFGHCLFSIGRDKRGWELFYSCPGRSRGKAPAAIERHFIAQMEAAFNRPNAPTHFCLMVDLHGFGLSDLDPRVGARMVQLLLTHYPDRIAQCAILDSPWVFGACWQLIKGMLDPLMQTKAAFLRGEQMSEYFARWFSPEQTQFMNEIVKLRAGFSHAAFPPITPQIRLPIGPSDAYMRETASSSVEESAPSTSPNVDVVTGGVTEGVPVPDDPALNA